MKISVVIPLYNAEKYILETLNSLINQTYPIDEILVVDDCGPDNSASIVEHYSKQYPVIKLLRQPHNQGGSAARNRGLQEAKNDWVLMMDADDTIHRDLLKRQIERLQEYIHVDPAPVCVHPAYLQTDADGNILENSEYRGQQLPFKETFGSLLVRNYIITPSGLLLNRDAALEIGGYKTNFLISEDAEFILRLSRKGTFVYLDKPYVYFRRHPMSITSDLKKASQAGKAILDIYTIDEIKEAVMCRNFPKQKNILDFVSLLYQYGRYEEGFKYLNQITEDDYAQSKLFLQSLFYIENKQFKEAAHYIDDLLVLNGEHGAALNNRAVLYAQSGNFSIAKQLFKKALELFPGYMDVTDNLKVLINGEGQYRFTKRELRKNLLRYS
ncbi:tetratricopeptide repeat protein [Ureibacillus xyleni]|uniref:Tetratricopeptide repeat protein n=1 Tax=Ureibacillus xyleni TaxID=614648 RepID=A0A285RBY9_9BACL|nr:glycosyltransferase [Ureibacillus xyleni]SOB91278.1 tetratricopeptide repeat protein [Ureibacillus xyleni]